MADVAATIGRRSRFGVSLPLLVALLAFAAVLATGAAVLGDPDTYWHIAAGRWMLAHHAVPQVDIFSYTRAGAPWVPHEWLSEIIMAGVFDRFGWAGLVVMTALLGAAAVAVLTRLLLRYLAPLPALIGASAAWSMALPHLLARPHSFGLPLLALWLAVLVVARSRNRAPPPAAALLMMLWANLHGGYIIGLVLAALLAGEAVVTAADRPAACRAAAEWALFGALALAAALATPNGLRGLWLPFHLMDMPFTLSIVSEWQSPNFQLFQPLELWLLAGLLGALVMGVRLPWTRVILLLLLLYLALAHVRDAELIGVAAPALLAEPLAREIARLQRRRSPSALDLFFASLARPAGPGGIAITAATALALAAVPLARGVAGPPGPLTPAAAVAAVTARHVVGPVVNDYNFGGYLIYSGIRPFIDGRADLYGDAFMKRYAAAIGGNPAALTGLLDRYHATWTLFAPGSIAVTLIEKLPGWQRLYGDDTAVVDIRR